MTGVQTCALPISRPSGGGSSSPSGGVAIWIMIAVEVPGMIDRSGKGQPMIPFLDFITGAKYFREKRQHENDMNSKLNAYCPRG